MEYSVTNEIKDITESMELIGKELFFLFSYIGENNLLKDKAEEKNNEIVRLLASINNDVAWMHNTKSDISNEAFRKVLKSAGYNCQKVYLLAKEIKDDFLTSKDANDYRCVLYEFRDLIKEFRALIKAYKVIAINNSFKSKVKKVEKLADDLFGDISEKNMEYACYENDLEYTQGDIAFLFSKISDYCFWIAEDVGIDEEDVIEIRMYLDHIKKDIVEANILLEDIEYLDVEDGEGKKIVSKIKCKLGTLERLFDEINKEYNARN